MELIETRTFTRQVGAALTADEYRLLQLHLMRIIYYWATTNARLYLLYLYPKNVRGALSRTELQMLRAQIDEMQ